MKKQLLETKKLILFEEKIGDKIIIYRQHKEDENKEMDTQTEDSYIHFASIGNT